MDEREKRKIREWAKNLPYLFASCGVPDSVNMAKDLVELLKEQDERIKELELEKGWDESPDMMGKW